MHLFKMNDALSMILMCSGPLLVHLLPSMSNNYDTSVPEVKKMKSDYSLVPMLIQKASLAKEHGVGRHGSNCLVLS